MPDGTNLGRVQPVYVGAYDSGRIYKRLDNVTYNGSSYVCKVEGVVNEVPTNINYWQLVAQKGEIGSLASASVVEFAEVGNGQGWASAEIVGDVGAQSVYFAFGIPAGPTGNPAAITSMTASAFTIPSAADPSVAVVFAGGTQATASFSFYFPPIATSVKSVDDQSPLMGSNGNIVLGAVRYTTLQDLDPTLQSVARQNIGAAAAPSESPGTDNMFIKYDTNGNPTFTTVRQVPNGGGNGEILTVTDNTRQIYSWVSADSTLFAISTSDIDAIINN